MTRILLALAGLAALTACASAPQHTASAPAGQRDCFRSENISGYSVIAERTLRIDVGANRRFALTTESSLRGAERELRLGVQSGSGFLCEGDALNVRIFAAGPPERFWQVVRIERLPDEAPVEGS